MSQNFRARRAEGQTRYAVLFEGERVISESAASPCVLLKNNFLIIRILFIFSWSPLTRIESPRL